jgi:uncharacterized protein
VEETLHDGKTLKQALKSAESVLEKRIDEINSLNVFPVPDGDTGINMYLTLQSANEAVKDNLSASASEIISKSAMGALMGARGNSGVIFSQIMRGLSKGLDGKEKFSARDFAEALRFASDTAYKSLAEPVEGTILTVIREVAEKAMEEAQQGADLKRTITAVTSQAKDTVTRTREMLPTLKEAGVVDAGGKGLFYVFLGMKDVIGQKMNPIKSCKTSRHSSKFTASESVYGFDLQFLIEGDDLPVKEIRDKINTMGESVLVVGDETLIRVHVHTKMSQAVMDYCSTKGRLRDIINDNMDTQVENFKKGQKEATKHHEPDRSHPRHIRSQSGQLSDSTISP